LAAVPRRRGPACTARQQQVECPAPYHSADLTQAPASLRAHGNLLQCDPEVGPVSGSGTGARAAPHAAHPEQRQPRQQPRAAQVQAGHRRLDARALGHNVQAAVVRHVALPFAAGPAGLTHWVAPGKQPGAVFIWHHPPASLDSAQRAVAPDSVQSRTLLAMRQWLSDLDHAGAVAVAAGRLERVHGRRVRVVQPHAEPGKAPCDRGTDMHCCQSFALADRKAPGPACTSSRETGEHVLDSHYHTCPPFLRSAERKVGQTPLGRRHTYHQRGVRGKSRPMHQ